MNMPRFTGEASLYKTSGYYQTGRHAINLPTKMTSPIHAAMIGEETITIHSCAPGYTDYGGSCFPNPLTEPSGGSGEGTGTPGDPGSEPHGPGGGGGIPFEKPVDRDKPLRWDRGCSLNQRESEPAQVCNAQTNKDMINDDKPYHYLRCTGKRKGKVVHPQMECCKGDADVTICDPLN